MIRIVGIYQLEGLSVVFSDREHISPVINFENIVNKIETLPAF